MWTLDGVTIAENTNAQAPGLRRLVRTVTMTFKEYDENGVAVDTHTYVEPNVSDVTKAGIAKLCRDQLAQLDKISASTAALDVGAVSADVVGHIRTLITTPSALSPSQVAALRAVADLALDDAALVASLNAATAANPIASAPMVAPKLDIATLLGHLSADERGALADSPNTPTLRADARVGDAQALAQWAVLRHDAGKLSDASFDTIVGACQPIADPAWSALVSRASLVLGRPATLADVAIVRAAD